MSILYVLIANKYMKKESKASMFVAFGQKDTLFLQIIFRLPKSLEYQTDHSQEYDLFFVLNYNLSNYVISFPISILWMVIIEISVIT